MVGITKRLKPACRVVLLGTAVSALMACTAIYRNHGYVPSDEDLAAIFAYLQTVDGVDKQVETFIAP